MKNTLTQKEYDEITEWVNYALSAPNKKSASKYLSLLKSKTLYVSGAVRNVLGELLASTSAASGQVDDKGRKESFCRMDLFKLESFVEK